MVQLIKIVKSNKKNKRFDAIFDIGKSKSRIISFGSKKYDNYTIHFDKERRRLYRLRHRNDNLKNPLSPGALSWYILWGDSTSINKNIEEFRRVFKA